MPQVITHKLPRALFKPESRFFKRHMSFRSFMLKLQLFVVLSAFATVCPVMEHTVVLSVTVYVKIAPSYNVTYNFHITM